MTAHDAATPEFPRVVLVTGGAGFIGSAVVRQLIRDTAAIVVNVDKLTYAGSLDAVAEVSANPRYHFAQRDVADASAMRALFERFRPDAVLHLAAETHVDRSIDGPAEFIRTNIVGTYTLLETARAHWLRLGAADRARFRFVHVSTDEVFGSLGRDGVFSEDAPYRPSSPYAASKASADHLVRSWHRTYGLPTLITNSSNNYGPYQFPEKLIPLITLRALAGGSLPVYGRGENVRDWLFVEDHAAALLAVLSRGAVGATYNVSGRSERRNLDLVHAICDFVDELCGPLPSGPRRSLVTFVADRPGHDLRYAIDDSRIRRELGWAPRETLASGLRRTVRWYAEHPDWGRRARAGGYDGERLGLGEAR